MPRVTGTMQRARGRRCWARLGIGLSSVLAIAACGSPLAPTSSDVAPDLQPIPLAGVEGFVAFCDLEGASLRVTVLNAGTADAEASSTKVAFDYSSRSAPVDTPAIAAGQRVAVLIELPQPVPANAYDFTITVDAGAAIAESSETNNYGEGQCPR
jgi:hypothetical protein